MCDRAVDMNLVPKKYYIYKHMAYKFEKLKNSFLWALYNTLQ